MITEDGFTLSRTYNETTRTSVATLIFKAIVRYDLYCIVNEGKKTDPV